MTDPNHHGVDLFSVIGEEFLDMTGFKVADLVLRLESDTHVGPVHRLRSETDTQSLWVARYKQGLMQDKSIASHTCFGGHRC